MFRRIGLPVTVIMKPKPVGAETPPPPNTNQTPRRGYCVSRQTKLLGL
jgi:hypothetical protein